MIHVKRVLLPVDFSKESELALRWSVRILRGEPRSAITLLHVLEPVPIVPESGFDIGKLMEERCAKAKSDLAEWRKKIPASIKTDAICAEGDSAREITSACKKGAYDLVVMTTAGRRGLSRVIHPNLTEKVVRSAPCPVLALHLRTRGRRRPKNRRR